MRIIAKTITHAHNSHYLRDASKTVCELLFEFIVTTLAHIKPKPHSAQGNADLVTIIGSYHPLSYEVNITEFNERIMAYHTLKLIVASNTNKTVGFYDNGKEVVPHIMVVPCIAVTHTKTRLGHGFGGYDSYLQKHNIPANIPANILTIGTCYHNNMVNSDICEVHDVPMSYVATEAGIF